MTKICSAETLLAKILLLLSKKWVYSYKVYFLQYNKYIFKPVLFSPYREFEYRINNVESKSYEIIVFKVHMLNSVMDSNLICLFPQTEQLQKYLSILQRLSKITAVKIVKNPSGRGKCQRYTEWSTIQIWNKGLFILLDIGWRHKKINWCC